MTRFLVLLLLVTPLATAQAPPGPSTVSLRYGWEPGMRGTIDVSGVRYETGEEDTDIGGGARFGLTVGKHVGGGLALTRRVRDVNLGAASAASLLDPAVLIQSLTPTLVVADGQAVGVDNAAEIIGQMRAMIASAVDLDSLFAQSPQARTAIDAMLSEAALLQSEAMWWNVGIGFWNGADLEVGEWYSTTFEQPVAMLGGVSIPYISEFSATEWAPCTDADPTPRCVWLEVDTYADEKALAKAVSDFVAQFGQPVAAGAMSGSSGGTALVDPTTLRPYTLITSKTVTVPDPDGEGGVHTREDIRTYTFVWEKEGR